MQIPEAISSQARTVFLKTRALFTHPADIPWWPFRSCKKPRVVDRQRGIELYDSDGQVALVGQQRQKIIPSRSEMWGTIINSTRRDVKGPRSRLASNSADCRRASFGERNIAVLFRGNLRAEEISVNTLISAMQPPIRRISSREHASKGQLRDCHSARLAPKPTEPMRLEQNAGNLSENVE